GSNRQPGIEEGRRMNSEATDARFVAELVGVANPTVKAPSRRAQKSLRHRIAATTPARILISVAPPLLVLALAIAAWDTWVQAKDIPKYMVPRPGAVLAQFLNDFGTIRTAFIATFTTALTGYVAAIIVGF